MYMYALIPLTAKSNLLGLPDVYVSTIYSIYAFKFEWTKGENHTTPTIH